VYYELLVTLHTSTMLTTSLMITPQVALPGATVVPASNCLRSNKAVRLRAKCQQTRAFRFGMWSSYLDPTFQKELRHRHRVARHKYMEALNRKLMWDDKQLPNYAKHLGLKGFMCSAWHGRDPTLGGRWRKFANERFDIGKFGASERGIEDVEQSALDHLMDQQNFPYAENLKSRIANFHRLVSEMDQDWSKPTSPNLSEMKAQRQSPADEKVPAANQEYDIDPITNRRVYKNSTAKNTDNARKPIKVPVKSFNEYRSRFVDFQPPTNAAHQKTIASTEAKLPAEHVNSVGFKPATTSSSQIKRDVTGIKTDVDDGYGIYDARVSYNEPFLAYEPDGQIESQENPDPVKECLKRYEEKTAPKNAEPQPSSLQSSIYGKNSDSQRSRTGDKKRENKRRLEAHLERVKQRLSKLQRTLADDYTSSHSQKSTKPNSTEEVLNSSDSRASYEKPSIAYETDGQANAIGERDSINEFIKDYDSRHPSGPVYHSEPDNHTCESYSKDPEAVYDDKHSYGPVYHNEPDGHAHESSPKDAEAVYDKNHPCGPVYYNEPDGHTCEPLPKDPEAVYDEKHSYGPVYHNEPDGHAFESPLLDAEAVYDRKHFYGPVYHNEPDGHVQRRNTVEDGLREYDSRVTYSPRPSSQSKYQKLFRHIEEPETSIASTRSEAELKPAEICSPYLSHGRRMAKSNRGTFEILKQKREISEENSKASQTKPAPKVVEHKKMTGNFVRDFPEESSVRWSTGMSEAAPLLPEKHNAAQVEGNVQMAEKEYYDGLASQERFSRKSDTPRLQTSLERSSTTKPTDPTTSSHETPDYQSSMQGEGDLSASITSCLNSGHGASTNIKAKKRSSNSSTKPTWVHDLKAAYEAGEPQDRFEQGLFNNDLDKMVPSPEALAEKSTHYKVLAYDPSTQSVSVAPIFTSLKGKTSFLPSPADVMPRLSNPAKFFPYFAQLLTEGYQIASGSGNVLVFRKVSGSTSPHDVTMASHHYQPDSSHINPIDGMQPVAATGNFASPTGFVNYEYPLEVPEEPRFKSNIDVRRTEPVFSGKKNWEDEPERKRGRGKRLLIGAAWVGACTYAVGVMAEFFKTGGLDGRGPVGF
jgi:hypothetical protein